MWNLKEKMGNFLSNPYKIYPEHERETINLRHSNTFMLGQDDSDYDYTNITATLFVVVMIVLLLVLLVCCLKTFLVCRRQKIVNDRRRRRMMRQNQMAQNQVINSEDFLRALTLSQQHQLELPGESSSRSYGDAPPAYEHVIGMPPSYDSIVILNGVQSRATSVVGSVLDTVRSLRRGSRGCVSAIGPTDSPRTAITSAQSDCGSAKSESLVASVSNAQFVHRHDCESMVASQSDSVKRGRSIRKPRLEEEESS